MDNQQRETKELIVGNHKLVVVTYITGRELRAIENAVVDKFQVKQKGTEQELVGSKSEAMNSREDELIRQVVRSFDGVAEGVVDLVLDLPAPELFEVTGYVYSLTQKKNQ
jgi:hypothetical protein